MKNLIEVDESKTSACFNTSLSHDIVTILIKCAGRHCKWHAGDLYCDLTWMSQAVQRLALGEREGVYRYALGIRDSGVDGPQFTKARVTENNSRDYKALFIFEAKEVERHGTKYIHQTLYRVNVSKMKLWLDEHFDECGTQLKEEFHPKEIEA